MLSKMPIAILVVALAAGCQRAEEVPMDTLDRGIQAHGGLDTWWSYGTLEYDYSKGDMTEHHLIDLHSRKLLLTGNGYTIGFDGEEVWISPGMDAFSSGPRFYSSLNFYFFGLPFLLADPGTIRHPLGLKSVGDETFDVVKIGYEEGVGDSPDDYYVAHFDTASGMMDLLLYTVTYRSQEPSERYNARVYEWQHVQGMTVPAKISAYRWNGEDGTLGDHRSDGLFTNVTFSKDRPDESLFTMPEGAEIDPLPGNGER